MRVSVIALFFLLNLPAHSAVKIDHWLTSKGASVFHVQTKGLPMVDIRVVFDAGSARDRHQQGVASLTSALLDTGAGEWGADEIAERFESVGAQFGSGVSKDMAWISLRSLTETKLLTKALQTMQVILTKPVFAEIDFQREKKRTLAGLKHRQESPGKIASIAFFNTLYKDHPYSHPSSGYIETVKGLSVDDLKAFYGEYYVNSNAMVVIVGEMNKQEAMGTAELLLSDLTAGVKPKVISEVKSSEEGERVHIVFPSSQTHVLAGLIGMHRKDKDYMSLYMGNHVLGGSGLVSLLFEEVREKRGLAYSAYSYFSPLFRDGPFTMGLQTRNDQGSEAVQVMHSTLEAFIEKGPTEKELLAAKKNITGGFAMRFDTNRKLTSYVSMIGFYQLPLNYLDVFQKKVEDVTVTSIKDAFKRRIKLKNIHTITVGGSTAKKPE